MRRCVIIGAAPIGNYDRIRSFLRHDDFFILCDGGLNHAEKLKITPNLIIGDFDSHANPNLDIETIVLPCEKDDTDSFSALKTAIKRGFKEFLFLGMTGKRFDHSLGNLFMLVKCHKESLQAVMIDDFSEMEIIGKNEAQIPDTYANFSLLNITGTAKKITIKNARYNLDEKEIPQEYQYGISNEVLPGKKAAVSVKEGCLLLVKIWK